MPNPLARAPWLALVLSLVLAACSQPQAQARLEAHAAQVDPPRLWQVQSMAADGSVSGEVAVCADATMRAGFERADAEADGRRCVPERDKVETPGLYATRCELDGRRYALTQTRRGDPARDFTVDFAFKALDGSAPASRQVRRYRLLGACPGDWKIGDQARPGESRCINALAGAWNER